MTDFERYLSERSQFVEIQNIQSDTKPISHGVLQGFILGPILFIIDINDFCSISYCILFFVTCCNRIHSNA